jgi:hypothetical protein
MARIMSDESCPNCGSDMIYDPCPGYPRGDGTPAPMIRGEMTHCTLCDQICCDDCRQRCEFNRCHELLCASCAAKGGERVLCPVHLSDCRTAGVEHIDRELEDLICWAIEVFGPDTPPVMAIIHAQTAVKQHQFEDVK